jgi:hypothetical protein
LEDSGVAKGVHELAYSLSKSTFFTPAKTGTWRIHQSAFVTKHGYQAQMSKHQPDIRSEETSTTIARSNDLTHTSILLSSLPRLNTLKLVLFRNQDLLKALMLFLGPYC